MTTAEDILSKSKTKKQSKFQPVQRRAWDYLDTASDKETTLQQENVQKKIADDKSILVVDNSEKIPVKTKKSKIDIENNLKPDNKDVDRENIDSPAKEAFHKKLLTLMGHQKEIMRLVTSHIKSRGGMPYTVNLFPTILANKTKTTIEVTRMSLKRLVEKNLLIRMKGEKGRNGCCKFKVREDVVKSCFTLFNDTPCDINLIVNETIES